jgi:uncharacterized protein (TIGR02678 family)
MTIRSNYQESLMEAHLALLEYEMITEQHESFELVRDFFSTLRDWHLTTTGWRLEHFDGKYFRLLKEAAALTALPLRGQSMLQTAQDYACLLWILSYAAHYQLTAFHFHQRFSLTQLADFIRECSCNDQQGIRLNFDERVENRRSLFRALKYLVQQGYLRQTQSSLETWLEQANDRIVFSFTDATLLLLKVFQPQLASAIIEASQEKCLSSDQATLPFISQPLPPLTRLWRSLLLGTSLLRRDDPEAFNVLTEHCTDLEQELSFTFGYELELFPEYAALVRPQGLPFHRAPLLRIRSVTDHILLLLCEQFREEVLAKTLHPDEWGWISLSLSDLMDLFLRSIRPRYGHHWGKEANTKSAEELLGKACQKMRSLDLIRGPDSTGMLQILPSAARFGTRYVSAKNALTEED